MSANPYKNGEIAAAFFLKLPGWLKPSFPALALDMAKKDVEDLIAERGLLREQNEKLRELLEGIEWSGAKWQDAAYGRCPECGGHRVHRSYYFDAADDEPRPCALGVALGREVAT